nr:MAG TPA: Protein of unknown function (DUF1372) [Caudoviricetes sp.]
MRRSQIEKIYRNLDCLVSDYGIFVVTREQWEKVKVGDEVML